MTIEQSPVIILGDLIEQLESDIDRYEISTSEALARAYAAGADQQLAEDAKWLDHHALNEAHLKTIPVGDLLKEAMRPKPPSLKEQAKFAAAVLRSPDETCSIAELQQHWHTICNALEQLND
jgi:hypothetical protein